MLGRFFKIAVVVAGLASLAPSPTLAVEEPKASDTAAEGAPLEAKKSATEGEGQRTQRGARALSQISSIYRIFNGSGVRTVVLRDSRVTVDSNVVASIGEVRDHGNEGFEPIIGRQMSVLGIAQSRGEVDVLVNVGSANVDFQVMLFFSH